MLRALVSSIVFACATAPVSADVALAGACPEVVDAAAEIAAREVREAGHIARVTSRCAGEKVVVEARRIGNGSLARIDISVRGARTPETIIRPSAKRDFETSSAAKLIRVR